MPMNQEIKESLQLSFKYLRAYQENYVLGTAEGWQGVYGDAAQKRKIMEARAMAEQPPEEEAREEEVAEEAPPVQPEAPRATAPSISRKGSSSAALSSPQPPVAGNGVSRGVGLVWIVLVLGLLFVLFR